MNPRRRDLIDPVDAMDHIRGPLHAPVTIVEYGDFECPTCRQATGALKILFDRYPEQIRLVFRHYPLEAVHPHALMAALASEAAASQGKFWRMHDALFANQNHLDMKHLRAYARDIGLAWHASSQTWTTPYICSACESTSKAASATAFARRRPSSSMASLQTYRSEWPALLTRSRGSSTRMHAIHQ